MVCPSIGGLLFLDVRIWIWDAWLIVIEFRSGVIRRFTLRMQTMSKTPPKQIEATTYYLTSVLFEGVLRFIDEEGRDLEETLIKVADFCGVELLAYNLRGKRIHILARCAGMCDADAHELLRRYARFYGDEKQEELRHHWQTLASTGEMQTLKEEQDTLRMRMWDIGSYMKQLKQLWTVNYNKQ